MSRSLRPATCHSPVSPGRTVRRSATNSGSNVSRISGQRPGPDEGHVAPEHVEQLRYLVDAELAHPARRSRRDPRVVLEGGRSAAIRPGRRIGGQQRVEEVVAVDDHRPQLQQPERPAVTALPLVAEEDRARIAHRHGQRGGADQGRRHDEAGQRHHHVEGPPARGRGAHRPVLIGTGGRPRRPPRSAPIVVPRCSSWRSRSAGRRPGSCSER